MKRPPLSHQWFWPKGIRWECCKVCGIVRRADDKNGPCKGPVKIGPRAPSTPDTGREG